MIGLDRERPFIIRALRKHGFIRDGGPKQDPLIFKKRIGEREVEVQLWGDGYHRASHMVFRPLPNGVEGGRMSTPPTDFGTVVTLFHAIGIELTREDHPPEGEAHSSIRGRR